ncbi:MAG TPA: hypothetical protein ENO00_09965 [Deltaproteobacteria bacterium]|nr:hypothetical protein [Deltaproteobacteria bacterium]
MLFLSAYALDLVIDDPRWIPHPVVIIGKFIRWLEERIPLVAELPANDCFDPGA